MDTKFEFKQENFPSDRRLTNLMRLKRKTGASNCSSSGCSSVDELALIAHSALSQLCDCCCCRGCCACIISDGGTKTTGASSTKNPITNLGALCTKRAAANARTLPRRLPVPVPPPVVPLCKDFAMRQPASADIYDMPEFCAALNLAAPRPAVRPAEPPPPPPPVSLTKKFPRQLSPSSVTRAQSVARRRCSPAASDASQKQRGIDGNFKWQIGGERAAASRKQKQELQAEATCKSHKSRKQVAIGCFELAQKQTQTQTQTQTTTAQTEVALRDATETIIGAAKAKSLDGQVADSKNWLRSLPIRVRKLNCSRAQQACMGATPSTELSADGARRNKATSSTQNKTTTIKQSSKTASLTATSASQQLLVQATKSQHKLEQQATAAAAAAQSRRRPPLNGAVGANVSTNAPDSANRKRDDLRSNTVTSPTHATACRGDDNDEESGKVYKISIAVDNASNMLRVSPTRLLVQNASTFLTAPAPLVAPRRPSQSASSSSLSAVGDEHFARASSARSRAQLRSESTAAICDDAIQDPLKTTTTTKTAGYNRTVQNCARASLDLVANQQNCDKDKLMPTTYIGGANCSLSSKSSLTSIKEKPSQLELGIATIAFKSSSSPQNEDNSNKNDTNQNLDIVASAAASSIITDISSNNNMKYDTNNNTNNNDINTVASNPFDGETQCVIKIITTSSSQPEVISTNQLACDNEDAIRNTYKSILDENATTTVLDSNILDPYTTIVPIVSVASSIVSTSTASQLHFDEASTGVKKLNLSSRRISQLADDEDKVYAGSLERALSFERRRSVKRTGISVTLLDFDSPKLASKNITEINNMSTASDQAAAVTAAMTFAPENIPASTASIITGGDKMSPVQKSIFDGASKDEILEYLNDARERVPEVLMAADEVMVIGENELIVVDQLEPGAPATPISIEEYNGPAAGTSASTSLCTTMPAEVIVSQSNVDIRVRQMQQIFQDSHSQSANISETDTMFDEETGLSPSLSNPTSSAINESMRSTSIDTEKTNSICDDCEASVAHYANAGSMFWTKLGSSQEASIDTEGIQATSDSDFGPLLECQNRSIDQFDNSSLLIDPNSRRNSLSSPVCNSNKLDQQLEMVISQKRYSYNNPLSSSSSTSSSASPSSSTSSSTNQTSGNCSTTSAFYASSSISCSSPLLQTSTTNSATTTTSPNLQPNTNVSCINQDPSLNVSSTMKHKTKFVERNDSGLGIEIFYNQNQSEQKNDRLASPSLKYVTTTKVDSNFLSEPTKSITTPPISSNDLFTYQNLSQTMRRDSAEYENYIVGGKLDVIDETSNWVHNYRVDHHNSGEPENLNISVNKNYMSVLQTSNNETKTDFVESSQSNLLKPSNAIPTTSFFAPSEFSATNYQYYQKRKLVGINFFEFKCVDCDQSIKPDLALEADRDGMVKVDEITNEPTFVRERLTSEELDKAYIQAMNGLPLCKICKKKRVERKEIISEFVETELKYGRDLKIIHDEFYRPMQVAGLLSKDQINGVFINLEELIMANCRFSDRLCLAIQEAIAIGDANYNTVKIGKLFNDSAEMLHTYETYCIRQGSAACLLARLAKEKELLRIFLRVSQMENALLRRMNLAAFLMVPIQRVTKYPLLLNRLYKVTAFYHKDREALREAQLKVELHLEHINQQTKDGVGATNKIWRRISNLSAPISSRRGQINTEDISYIKLRKTALDLLKWDRDETQFIHSGKLSFASLNEYLVKNKNRSLRYLEAHALLIVLGKPNWRYRPDLVKSSLDSKLMRPTVGETGIKEAVLLLFREKGGRFALCRDPFFLKNCVLSADNSQCNIDWQANHLTSLSEQSHKHITTNNAQAIKLSKTSNKQTNVLITNIPFVTHESHSVLSLKSLPCESMAPIQPPTSRSHSLASALTAKNNAFNCTTNGRHGLTSNYNILNQWISVRSNSQNTKQQQPTDHFCNENIVSSENTSPSAQQQVKFVGPIVQSSVGEPQHTYHYNHHNIFHHAYGDYEEPFELHECYTKESVLLRADTPVKTRFWLQILRYHSKDLGQWRLRRNGLANIMMVRQE